MIIHVPGAQWLSGRVLDLRSRGCWFESHWKRCVLSLSAGSIMARKCPDMTRQLLYRT